MSESRDSVLTARELQQRLERGHKFFVLDVRNRDEFARSRLEGREGPVTINVPYFEMLELGGKDDMVESVASYIRRELAAKLPRDLPILTVCAKGVTSTITAQALRSLGYATTNLAGGMKAWAELYTTLAVVEAADLAIYQVARPARGCLSYIVASDGEAIVIDPLRHLDAYLELASVKNFKIVSVLDTHAHADHISGGPALAAKTGAAYYLHPYDAIHPVDMLPTSIDYAPIRDGQIFAVGRQRLEAIHIPGHTLGLTALCLDDRYLFCGDSIFIHSIARPDLGGKAEGWAPLHARSLRKLLELPGSITVLPGHFSSLDEANDEGIFAASLDDLKQRNGGLLRLQQESEAGFVGYLLQNLPPPNEDYLEIKRVNAGLRTAAEDDAWALELGKNVCGLAAQTAAVTGGNQ